MSRKLAEAYARRCTALRQLQYVSRQGGGNYTSEQRKAVIDKARAAYQRADDDYRDLANGKEKTA